MKKHEVNQFLKDNWHLSYRELMAKTGLTHDAVYKRGVRMGLTKQADLDETEVTPVEQIKIDIETGKEKSRLKIVNASYKEALGRIDFLERQVDAALAIKGGLDSYELDPIVDESKKEMTIVALASDWHVGEEVKAAAVNDMNFYNLEESRRRADHYFKTILHCIKIDQKSATIKKLVLGLLGDFISGDIHEDISKSCLVQPIDEILLAQTYLISGINFLLDNSELEIVCVCHTGNHGRKDREQMIANEAGNSLEYLMYKNMEMYYASNPRVKFVVERGYHSYLKVYDTNIRFHHGHAVRYGGGVGGLTVPMNKAIAQWDRGRKADLSLCGHFHQIFDGNNFITNGSLIGFNAYAINIKAAFEPPAQVYFGIHSKHGRILNRKIVFS